VIHKDKQFHFTIPNINHLKDTDWAFYPNFHVSFMTSNLVWFHSDDSEHYLQFWKDNVGEIYQQKRDDVPKYLKWLADEKVINMTKKLKKN